MKEELLNIMLRVPWLRQIIVCMAAGVFLTWDIPERSARDDDTQITAPEQDRSDSDFFLYMSGDIPDRVTLEWRDGRWQTTNSR